MGIWLEGKPLADKVREKVAREVARIKAARGTVPGLVAVIVGDDPASQSYVRMKEKACRALGLWSEVLRLPASTPKAELKARIEALNAADHVDGILVQMPLPSSFDAHEVVSWLRPDKDVDGFHPVNLGLLLESRPGLRPCTPSGIIDLIKSTDVRLDGAEAVVVGRSMIVGKPVAAMLTNENATVTVCHSRTRDLARVTSRADVLIAALGRPGFLGLEHVKPGAVVVDVGSNAVSDADVVRSLYDNDPRRIQELREKGYTWVGDVDPRVIDKAGWMTPSPGGVGPLTIAYLMKSTLEAYTLRRG